MNNVKILRFYLTIFFSMVTFFEPSIGGQNGDTISKLGRLPAEVSEHLSDYWHLYKASFNKTYTGKAETTRRLAWEKNLLKIYEHNLMAAAGHHGYTLRDNHIADLSTRHYIREMVKLTPSRRRRVSDEQMVMAVLHDPRKIPSSLDWRELGFVTSPVNQRDCGSCYAYSIAGSLQGQIFKQTGMIIPLSAQQLVDCSTVTGNMGCSGGSLRNTLRYLEKSRGIMSQIMYPYKSKQGQCKFQEDMSVANITSWAILPARDERALEAAVATIGPIATSINASPKTFQLYQFLYKRQVFAFSSQFSGTYANRTRFARTTLRICPDSILPTTRQQMGSICPHGMATKLRHALRKKITCEGVYDDPTCSSDLVNHAMLIVGYTPTEWILKNWWGEQWGEGGYMRLRKNKNRCGVANYASYAKV